MKRVVSSKRHVTYQCIRCLEEDADKVTYKNHCSILINYSNANKLTVKRNELEELRDKYRRVDEEYDIDLKEMNELCDENKRACRLHECIKFKHYNKKKIREE